MTLLELEISCHKYVPVSLVWMGLSLYNCVCNILTHQLLKDDFYVVSGKF